MTEKITSDTIKSEIKNKKKIQKPSKHDLIQSLIEKNILLEEYQNKMKYMQADFENYRKRIDKEKVDLIKKANEEIIVESIDVLESIEKSLNLTSEIKIEKTFVEGLKLTYDNFKKILEKNGLSKIITKDKIFDPYIHEAILVETKKNIEDDIILEEFQTGYKIHDKIVRFSKVKVGKKEL